MTLSAECAVPTPGFADAVAASLQSVTKLKGRVELVAPGTLADDGKVIADERSYGCARSLPRCGRRRARATLPR